MLSTLVLSVFFGSISGFLYGFFFLVRREGIRIFFVPPLAHGVLGTFGCFAICFFLSFYLLPLPALPFILVIISFFALFWMTVIKYKGKRYE